MKRSHRFLSNMVAAALVGAVPLPVVQAQLPTVSIKAVVINPFCIGGANAGALCMNDAQCDSGVCGRAIEPTNHVFANPGDIIVAEVFASDWSPNGEGLFAYAFVVTALALEPVACGDLALLAVPRPCRDRRDCPSPTGHCLDGFCDPTCFCSAIGEIDQSRPDFVFFAKGFFGSAHLSGSDHLRVLAALSQPIDASPYAGIPAYLATVRYRVPFTAVGNYEVQFAGGPDLVARNGTFITPLVVESLVVSTRNQLCPVLVDPNTPSCVIDTIQPEDPELLGADGRDSLELTLLRAVSRSELTIRIFPPMDTMPRIISVDGLDPAVVLLDRPIPSGRWTCVERIVLPGDAACFGSLPGDVNGDRISTEADVADLRSLCLPDSRVCGPTGCFSCDARRCDVNGSGQCTPADLLRVIDLLNGAIGGVAWLDLTIDPCPFQFP